MRIHGTTKEQPLVRFQTVERAQLQPLAQTAYDMAIWKKVKLHRDCHLIFDHAYYSAPYRLIGQQLWVSGGIQTVRIYTLDHQLVATHDRAQQPGQRCTHLYHLPPEKVPGLTLNREGCLARAEQVGEATLQVAQTLLGDPIVDRLYTVGRLLKLRCKFGDSRLEDACQRALSFDEPDYRTVKRILTQGLETQPIAEAKTAPEATTFARSSQELVGHMWGGESWN